MVLRNPPDIQVMLKTTNKIDKKLMFESKNDNNLVMDSHVRVRRRGEISLNIQFLV